MIPSGYDHVFGSKAITLIIHKSSINILLHPFQAHTVIGYGVCVPHSACLSSIHISEERGDQCVICYWKWVIYEVIRGVVERYDAVVVDLCIHRSGPG